jgi:hypothetical protein
MYLERDKIKLIDLWANGKALEDSLEEWMHSDELNRVRREMLDPKSDFKQTKYTCQRCIADEARYGRSRRTACMKIHSNDANYWKKVEHPNF